MPENWARFLRETVTPRFPHGCQLGKRLASGDQPQAGSFSPKYESPPHSLRPCWTVFVRILHGCSALSHASIPVPATECLQ
ncbi:MAG: hypothetical protein JSR31_13485 [Nitrospira sp.]|nr:hypothetical protein [Nitrospira sp.]